MKLKIHENSLFALLLRAPWWVSVLVTAAVVAGSRLLLPTVYAIAAALPFAVIAAYVGWKQLLAPSAGSVAKMLERVRGMSWEEFSGAIEEAFRREGYAVTRLAGTQADFELAKGGRTTLVACKRWKATRTGIEPLRELEAARRAREAQECSYVCAGELSDQAREFAARKAVRLVQGAELARLLSRV